MKNRIDSPLAITLFETLLDRLGDAELNRLHAAIEEHKTKYPRTIQKLMEQAFAGTTLSIIEDEWAYRNQDLRD